MCVGVCVCVYAKDVFIVIELSLCMIVILCHI